MNNIRIAVAALALACAAPLSAATDDVLPSGGDDISKFRDAGAWSIYKNATRGSCFAAYKSTNGEIVQFGFTKDEGVGYLGLFAKGAKMDEAESNVAVIVNGNLYTGTASGTGQALQEGYAGGYVLVNNPMFVKDIEMGQVLTAFPDTPRSYIVDMSGAANAVYEVRKCTSELGG
ncbi:hypothetical protein OO012_11485 [Rhodobacteraceae bacterium KMM 6894]|nr:hypothetical protein [Rhodobacteraceae bacterium KMM 6894]